MRVLFALVGFSLSAWAVAGGWQNLAQLQEAARAYAASQSATGAELAASALDPRLRLPHCPEALSGAVSARAAASLTVAMSCAAPAWTVYVPVRLSLARRVLVLTQAVARGQALTAELMTLEPRDAARLQQTYFTSLQQALGQTLKRPLPAGSVLSAEVLQAARLIRRGDRVSLRGRAGTVEVRAEGLALSDGVAGERIRVENASSRRVVEGTVQPDGAVEVKL